MTITELATYIPVTDEDIVDYHMGSANDQAVAAARLRVKVVEREARWRALPWPIRVTRMIRARSYEPRRRLEHALAALRGVECEP